VVRETDFESQWEDAAVRTVSTALGSVMQEAHEFGWRAQAGRWGERVYLRLYSEDVVILRSGDEPYLTFIPDTSNRQVIAVLKTESSLVQLGPFSISELTESHVWRMASAFFDKLKEEKKSREVASQSKRTVLERVRRALVQAR
jgi:hypothetical protein